jgi:UDP-N-acetylglucosamine 4,6-dehydratase (inverting)
MHKLLKNNINFFKNKTLLITGGTGSFGNAFVKFLLSKKIPLKKIIVFSRDELKQYQMSRVYSEENFSNIRYFLGDIRDKSRLLSAFENVDIVIHAAALKQVVTAEYNPIEFIKTNVIGSQNVIECSLQSGVQSIVALSTDKASSPINLYGATKLCADKLFSSANNIKGTKKIKFSIVRYGNVMGSRGSVLHSFIQQKKNNELFITEPSMTRFNIMLEEAINMVMWTILNAKGGEIFVPKIPSFNITDLAKVVCEKCKIKIIGIRPGEKIHEEMISSFDSKNTFDLNKYYAIVPENLIKFYKNKNYKLVDKNFSYNSKSNKDFLGINDLKKIVKNFNKAEIKK